LSINDQPQEGGDRPLYLVKIDDYEGPLDRLLRLVEKQVIDASTVPVHVVIQQLVDFLEAVSYADIDEGGRFLVMAATLLAIKAQLLLPQREAAADAEPLYGGGDGDEDGFAVTVEDEYLVIRGVARTLDEYARNWVLSHRRPVLQDTEKPVQEIRDDVVRLVTAFKEIMGRTVFEPVPYQVEMAVDFEEKMDAVFKRISGTRGGLPFHQLFENAERLEMIYSFLAVLELVFRGRLRLSRQDGDGELKLVALRPKTRRET
jgi:segregation and condensation protein A